MKIRIYNISNLIDFLVPFFILFDIYRIFDIPLSFIYIVILGISKLLISKKINIKNPFIILFFIIFLHSVVFYILFSNINIIKNLLFSMISIFTIFVFYKKINIISIYNGFKIVFVISAIGVVYHSIIVYVLKQSIDSPIFIFPKLVDNINIAYNSFRPLSFFSEPQAIATFVLLFLALSYVQKNYYWALFALSVLILTGSSLGIIVSVIMIIYILVLFRKKELIIFGISSIVIIYVVLFESNVFQQNFEKIMNISLYSDLRISNGFKIFFQLPLVNKFFGIGLGNIEQFTVNNSINVDSFYTSSISSIMINFGILIFVIYTYTLFRIFLKSGKNQRIIIALLLILSFGQTIYLNSWFTLYIVTLFAVDNSLAEYKTLGGKNDNHSHRIRIR